MPLRGRHSGPTVTFFIPRILLSTMASPTHNARIELAMADPAKQLKPNYMATAKKHGMARSTLRERFLGESLSIQTTASKYRQRLTFVQEKTLIEHINRLTNRGLPPTSQIVRNFAKKMIKGPVGKNWTGSFVKRHKNRLLNLHLRNIDSQRITVKYVPSFKLFFDLVILI